MPNIRQVKGGHEVTYTCPKCGREAAIFIGGTDHLRLCEVLSRVVARMPRPWPCDRCEGRAPGSRQMMLTKNEGLTAESTRSI